jgi:site-specific recombinase XerD
MKHKTILILTYSSGLRVSEVVNLEPQDILRDKMLLKIRDGKGNKDRYTILSKVALKYLERYWKAFHPKKWLFPGYHQNQLSKRACQHAYEIAKRNAKISKKGGIHTLRHSFATHFLEAGGSLFQLQKFMGHKYIRTTLQYAHIQEEKIIARSPLDFYLETHGK